MASIVKDIVINVPAASVWAKIRDFGKVHTLVPGLLADCQLDGDARGVIFQSGGRKARELLVSIDDDVRRLVYAEPDGPFITRDASCQVLPLTTAAAGSCGRRICCPMSWPVLSAATWVRALPDLKPTLESLHAESAHL